MMINNNFFFVLNFYYFRFVQCDTTPLEEFLPPYPFCWIFRSNPKTPTPSV